MSPRTRIRHLDIRQITPQTPGRDVGEESTSRGRYLEADCLATDIVGDFVRITGAPVLNFYQVSKIDITNPAHFPVVGVITEKSTTTRCFVQRFGIVDVSVFPAAPTLTPGAKYWVGFDSRLRSTTPVPLSGVSIVQQVGQALSSTELLILEGTQPIKLIR